MSLDINIALIKYHNDNSTNKVYNEIEFCYKRHWEFVDGKFVIYRWELDSPKPSYADLKKYNSTEIQSFYQQLEEIKNVKNHTILTTANKEFLKSFAEKGSLIFEPKTKKLFIFINGEWLKI